MGRDEATLALAIVSTKAAAHFSRSAGGYFRRYGAQAPALHLQRSLWALHQTR
jgi:replication initiation protein RepC